MINGRLLLGILTLVAATITGCSSDSAGLPDGGSLLREAAAASESVASAHVSIKTSGGVVPGFSVQSLEADVTREGGKDGGAKGSLVLLLDSRPIPTEFVSTGGETYIKGRGGEFELAPDADGGAALPDPAALLDPKAGMSKVLANVQDPVTEAKENVNGALLFRVTGKVAKEALTGVIPGVQSDAEVVFWVPGTGLRVPSKSTWRFIGLQGEAPTIDVFVSDVGKPVTVTAPAI